MPAETAGGTAVLDAKVDEQPPSDDRVVVEPQPEPGPRDERDRQPVKKTARKSTRVNGRGGVASPRGGARKVPANRLATKALAPEVQRGAQRALGAMRKLEVALDDVRSGIEDAVELGADREALINAAVLVGLDRDVLFPDEVYEDETED